MAIVIVSTDDPVAVSEHDTFSSAVKRPAGDVTPDPEFTLYLGTNTGPYKKADNGSVILPPIPIEWVISPQNVTVGQCPSSTDNLRLFGVTNAIVLTLALVLGCRPLLRYITRGLFGRPSRYSWVWSWTISCGLQVASNAIVSHLIVTTSGYEHLSMINVFALYSSRPRVNQLWMALLRLMVGPIYLTEIKMEEPEWVYTDSYVTTCIAELTLHLISAVFIGVTWRRFPNVPIREYMKTFVNLMIAAPAVALISWVFVPIWFRRNKGIMEYISPGVRITMFTFILGIPDAFTYGVAWIYWSVFLQLPGSL
jgi:hypothetical protein